jgi:hypothetical protein
VLATTAHGSGDKTTSGIWDTLLEITWVDGTGKVHVSKPSDPEFRGMVGGMGTYGRSTLNNTFFNIYSIILDHLSMITTYVGLTHVMLRVDGTGKVHVSKAHDPEFRGMVGGMGTYGKLHTR